MGLRQGPANRNHQQEQPDPPPKKGGDKRQTHSREAGHPVRRRRTNPPARQQRTRHPRGPSKAHQRTALPRPTTPSREQRPTRGKDTPDTPTHTPLEQRWARRKTIGAGQAKGEGGTETKSPKTGQAPVDSTRLRHDKAENHTSPLCSPEEKKEQKGRWGTSPTHDNSRTSPHDRQPHQKVTGNRRGARKRPRAPTPKPEKNGVHAKPKPTHTHTRPPGLAGHKRTAHTNTHTHPNTPARSGAAENLAQAHTHTAHCSQELPGTSGAGTQTHTHPNSRAKN